MKDKLKLALLLVVVAAVGIAIVLGSWLYGSYNQRMGLFAAFAEQSLFEAVQEVAQDMEKNYPDSVIQQMQMPGLSAIKTELTKEFPEISKRKLSELVDSVFSESHMAVQERLDSIREKHEKLSKEEQESGFLNGRFLREERFPRRRLHLIPLAFSRGTLATDSTIRQIKEKFDDQLSESNIQGGYVLSVEKFGLRDGFSQVGKQEDNMLFIRPLLIDPQQGLFIVVKFDQPWQLILYSMSWQLVVSVFILAIVSGTFVYLFVTIIRQNKLDMLRKAFVNSLTHELRTPVTTVVVALEALHDYFDADNHEIREEYYQMAIEELDHLSLMIDRVLDIAEGDHNEERMMQTEDIDFNDIVAKCVDHAKFTSSSQGVSITLQNRQQTLFLNGDPHHLKNVLNNLLDNAIKYGASIINVVLDLSESKSAVILRVEDNGIGIPTAYQQQVFEPFFRVPRGDLYSVKGFGLGLPYVKRVISQHAGKIQLRSELGKGTTFIIEIPNKRP